MPPPKYLAWLQPICYNSRLVFIHDNTAKVLFMVKTSIKKYRAAAKLISKHESIKQQTNSKIIASSKNTFQNIGALQNCSLKKYISEHKRSSKLLPQKMHFKTLWHGVS